MSTILVKTNVGPETTKVRMLIKHPMETGLRKNKKTGKKIPAHFIKTVICDLNGTNVLTADWGIAISKNPYLSFIIKGAKASDVLKISWADNKGEHDTRQGKLSEL
jgi:sulfur-oxidizing protein SoxZ